jgi:hypothetical protein
MWSKVKAYLRKVKARTKAPLDNAIAEASDLITPTDISGWFRNDGYIVYNKLNCYK